jgi:hypothetical protein
MSHMSFVIYIKTSDDKIVYNGWRLQGLKSIWLAQGWLLGLYRVIIKSFPDYKHLLQENYVEYKHMQL